MGMQLDAGNKAIGLARQTVATRHTTSVTTGPSNALLEQFRC